MRPSSAGTIPTFAKDFIGDNSPATLPSPASMPSLSGPGSLSGGMSTALAPAGSGNSSGNSLVETFQSASPYASRGTDEGVGRQTHVRRMPGARRRGGLLLRKLLDRRAGLGHGASVTSSAAAGVRSWRRSPVGERGRMGACWEEMVDLRQAHTHRLGSEERRRLRLGDDDLDEAVSGRHDADLHCHLVL